ncbi:MAG: hypothetical protein QXY79_01005 [Candidatus Methanomethylicia archaeon]
MFKSNAKGIIEKLEWIMQILNEMNTKINENISRVMKLEAELKRSKVNEIEEQLIKVIESIGKVKEVIDEAEKFKETLNKITNSDILTEIINKSNILQENTMKIMDEIAHMKNEMKTNLNTIIGKMSNIE